jgi:endonuclease I
MKQKLLILLLLVSSIAFSQIPSYYNSVDVTQNGNALKDDLATKIISTHTTFLSYTPGVWNALEEADQDPNNSNNVLLIYGYNDTDGDAKTDRTRAKSNRGGGLGLWNREHSYPKSIGTPNLGTSGPGSDAHHLRACDGQMNSTRNNRKYADGNGNAGITSQGHFYPGDEWKGDVARMMLFMYLRYDNRCLPKNVGVGSALASDNNMIDLFLQWNVDDPVNAFEDNRNSTIAGIQGNRNPFIDNPAFATKIWGGPQAEDRFGTGTGPGDGGNTGSGTELFISEYVEGSSNNKAIEIANFTGNSISLSIYSIRKQTNGAGSWSSGFSLSGSLSNGSVHVVANSSASSSVTSQANVTTGNAALTFNGNDAVGLFKNGVLIDVVGTYNGGSSNFAKDKTLRRKETITAPNTTYTTTEWSTFAQNTFSGLGTHTISGSTPPNPTPTPTNYCSSKGNNASFEYIDFVGIGGISNTTATNGGYADFTSQTGNITYGANTIVLSVGFSSTSYTEYWKVWIDFNKNGTFESSEEVVTGSTSSSGNLSYNFNVPSSALAGNTRMRVSMKWDATQTACETFSYGEVEDYIVNIGSSSRVALNAMKIDGVLTETAKVYDTNIYNTFSGVAVTMKDDRLINYTIYNLTGLVVKKGTFKRNLNVQSLEDGTYIFRLNDGQRVIQKKVIKK